MEIDKHCSQLLNCMIPVVNSESEEKSKALDIDLRECGEMRTVINLNYVIAYRDDTSTGERGEEVQIYFSSFEYLNIKGSFDEFDKLYKEFIYNNS